MVIDVEARNPRGQFDELILPANIWRLDTPEGKIAQMVTVIDGNIILLTGMGDLFLFDPIAVSLQQLTTTKPGG